MALTTQCPHCQTTFRVVHDQLKLRAGLVRCGSCKQIFNGIEHLVRPEDLAPPPASADRTSPQAPAPAVEQAPPIEATIAAAQAAPDHAAAPAPGASTVDFISIDGSGQPGATADSDLDLAPATVSPSSSAVTPTKADAAEADEEEDGDPLQRMTLIDFSAFDEDDTPLPHAQPAADQPQQHPATPEQPLTPEQFAVPEQAATPQPTAAAPAVTRHPQAENLTTEELLAPAGLGDDIGEPGVAANDVRALAEVEEDGRAAEAEGHAEAAEAGTVDAYAKADAAEAEAEDEADIEEPSFVTRARKKQRMGRILRIVLVLGSLLLLLGAIAQGAYAFRNQLAAWFPQTKPVLTQLCQTLGCQVQLPAQIDMVSIESHELQALVADQNMFALTLLLRNRSMVTQAWPDIELMLNDSDEKPLVRRVLTPGEYLPSAADVVRGFSPQSEQPVKVSFELLQVQASGYRVYLFYP